MARMNWRCRMRTGCIAGLSVVACLALRPARADEPPAAQSSQTAPAGTGEPEADAALRGLLGGRRASVDPAFAELDALCAELAEHPLATSAGKLGLDRARAELARLRASLAQQADADSIALQKQRVWAALALADRQIARAALAAEHKAAERRVAQADVRLDEARRAREQAEAELSQLRQSVDQAHP
jgi:hypothetical protein